MAIQLATPLVIAQLPRFELAANRLQLNEMDAREAVCGPGDDAIRPALWRRVELLAHSTMQFDLFYEVGFDLGLLRMPFEFAGAHISP